MVGELEKQIRQILKSQDFVENVIGIINSAGKEFPCLSCPSKANCGTFEWFVKWFGQKSIVDIRK